MRRIARHSINVRFAEPFLMPVRTSLAQRRSAPTELSATRRKRAEQMLGLTF